MSGFIDTLVARAMASAPPGAVRPQVRSLFEPEPESALAGTPGMEEMSAQPWSEVEQRSAADSSTTRQSAVHSGTGLPHAQRAMQLGTEAERTVHLDRQTARPVPPAPIEQAQMPGPTLTPTRQARPARSDEEVARSPRPAPGPGAPARAGQPPANAEMAPRPAPPAIPGKAMPHSDRTAVMGPPALDSGSVSSGKMPSQAAVAAPTLRTGSLQPAPLPPPPAAPRLVIPPAPRRLPETRSERQDHGGNAAPPVHVSIGRIEIRATTPPRAPVRKESSAPQPLGLDDYLRQRARGGRP